MDKSVNSSGDLANTLALSLAARLRLAIMKGELRPNVKLKLDELRKRFGVSHSPLREALTRLTAEGLVCNEGQRGYWVAPISEPDLTEVTRLRLEFESLALRESIGRADEAWEREVAAALQRVEQVERNLDGTINERWEQAHRQFHMSLLANSGMPMLLRIIGTLHDLGDRYRRLFLQIAPSDRDVPDEHRRIAEAAIARQADLAVALLRLHIERTGRNVYNALTQAKHTSDSLDRQPFSGSGRDGG